MDINKYVLRAFVDELGLIKEAISTAWLGNAVSKGVAGAAPGRAAQFAEGMAAKARSAGAVPRAVGGVAPQAVKARTAARYNFAGNTAQGLPAKPFPSVSGAQSGQVGIRRGMPGAMTDPHYAPSV